MSDIAPLAVFVLAAAFGFLWTPLGRALAERVRSRGQGSAPDDTAALREDLTAELQQVRRDLAELSERVDFAERLLAKQREAERLAPPR